MLLVYGSQASGLTYVVSVSCAHLPTAVLSTKAMLQQPIACWMWIALTSLHVPALHVPALHTALWPGKHTAQAYCFVYQRCINCLLLFFTILQDPATRDTAGQGSSNDAAVQTLMSTLQRLEAKVDLLADSMRAGLQQLDQRLARLEAGSAAFMQQ
jgi:hypothetical protein